MPRAENLESRMTAEQQALDYFGQARQQVRRLHQTVAALGVLFGRPVRQALDLRVEPVCELYDEACDNYRQALDDLRDEVAGVLDQAHQLDQALQTEVVYLQSVLADALAWRDTYKKRMPRSSPRWVEQARTVLEAAEQSEPF